MFYINSDVGAAETLLNDQDDSLILKNEIEEDIKTDSNGLENFGIEEDTPDLFENSTSSESSEQLQNIQDENSDEEEFEIPAFLRRQKN